MYWYNQGNNRRLWAKDLILSSISCLSTTYRCKGIYIPSRCISISSTIYLCVWEQIQIILFSSSFKTKDSCYMYYSTEYFFFPWQYLVYDLMFFNSFHTILLYEYTIVNLAHPLGNLIARLFLIFCFYKYC